MSDLSTSKVLAADRQQLFDLRRRAVSRLSGANATQGARAADALTVLHALASSPHTAADALALLHELQVHQVELDLQAQELREARAELDADLRRQIALYDGLPVGCFTIDARGLLHELNLTGAGMLALARDDALGLPLNSFFCADSSRRFSAMLANVDAGAQQASCPLTLCPRDAPSQAVLASLAADPAAKRYLLCLMPAADESCRR